MARVSRRVSGRMSEAKGGAQRGDSVGETEEKKGLAQSQRFHL